VVAEEVGVVIHRCDRVAGQGFVLIFAAAGGEVAFAAPEDKDALAHLMWSMRNKGYGAVWVLK
jgi:hypothetical protein